MSLQKELPGENLLLGYGRETATVHKGASGIYLTSDARTFHLDGRPAGGYQGVLWLAGAVDPQQLTAQPPMPRESAGGGPPKPSPVPVIGNLVVRFHFGDGGDSVTVVASGTGHLTPLSDGSAYFMISAMGLISGGTGAYRGASGVASLSGISTVRGKIGFVPGTAFHFKTLYNLHVIREEQEASKKSQPEPVAPELPKNVDLLTYELNTVDRLLSRVANFTLTSVPGKAGNRPIEAGGAVVGIEVRQQLHAMEIVVQPPTKSVGVQATQALSGVAADLAMEWRFIPDGWVAAPGAAPPATALDPLRPQRFVVRSGRLRFGDAVGSGVEVFGTGRTFPIADSGGQRLRVGAALKVTAGHGPFAGLPGMVALNAVLEPPAGLSTAVLVRVADLDGGLFNDSPPAPRPVAAGPPDRESTLLLVKGENDFHRSTSLIRDERGDPIGANLRQNLRPARIGFADGPRGPRTHLEVGEVVAGLTGTLWFDLAAPPPVPFTTERGIFTFRDRERQEVGWLEACIVEGRGFPTQLPGAPTPILRGVGLAPILRGIGPFAGATGLLTVANWISIVPRQVSSLFLIRLDDPDGRFRAGPSSGRS